MSVASIKWTAVASLGKWAATRPGTFPVTEQNNSGKRPRQRSVHLKHIRCLKRELHRIQRERAEAEALLLLMQRHAPVGRRGQWHSIEERQQILSQVTQLRSAGIHLKKIGSLLGVSVRTIQRWQALGGAGDHRGRAHRPVNRLSDAERERLLTILHSEQCRELSPKQLVPRLADEGIYLASESTMYRLLRIQPRSTRTPRGSARTVSGSAPLVITAPNRAWSWDITRLKVPAQASLYLYLIMDVFSRRIMGWEIHEVESAELASALIQRTCKTNAVDPCGLILHSDNGGPMRGATMLLTLQHLGITPSYSRPGVHDDNAFSEALFRTLKSHPAFPKRPFTSYQQARTWLEWFVTWYNRQHRHSAIGFVTPDDRYSGKAHSLLLRRRQLYERMRGLHPARWAGRLRDWNPTCPVLLRTRLYPQPSPGVRLSPYGPSVSGMKRQLD